MKTFFCLILTGLFAAACLAQPPRTRFPGTTYNHHEQEVTYNSQHVRHRDVVRIVSVAQINPAYLSSYSPDSYDSVTQAQVLQEIQALTARIDQLQLFLKNPGAGLGPNVVAPVVVVLPIKPGDPPVVVQPTPIAPTKPPPVQPVPGPVAALQIIQTHCAACHQAGKLLPDQKFTLLDEKGVLVTLTAQQKLRLIQKTRTSQMPPPSNTYGIAPLTDLEFSAVADLMGQ